MDYIHQHGIRAVSAQRFDASSRTHDACWVVEEETLTIDVEGIGAYTLMWTPTELVAAPCGFTPGDGVLAEQPGVASDLARIDAQQMPLAYVCANVSVLLRDVAASFAAAASVSATSALSSSSTTAMLCGHNSAVG